MADWTTITETATDPDSPVTSSLIKALRDNPVAITEAASGAPRINVAAFTSPVAGTADIVARIRNLTATSVIVNSDPINVVRSGVIRLTFNAIMGGAGASVNVRRLGSTDDIVFTASSSGSYSVDITITRGQVLYLTAGGASGTTSVSAITFQSGNGGGILA